MANEEQLSILKQGVEVWNKWREKNPNVDVDLSKADLRGANLSRANLSKSNLIQTDFRQANLSEVNFVDAKLMSATLKEAKLNCAYLSDANLYHANLSETDMREANLTRVNLQEANLFKVNLVDAHLVECNFSEANLGYTTFGNSDLRQAKGLENINHTGPSFIQRDIFVLSEGTIPDVFLQGCGLSDWEIEIVKLYNPDLSNEVINDIQYKMYELRATRAFQISSLFISYSHTNRAFIDKLGNRLTEVGIRYWRDIHEMKAGRIETQIDRGIRQNPTVLLVLSEHSINSDWVEHEAKEARKLEKETGRDVLCPVALDDSWKSSPWPKRVMEQIMEYNILDFSAWKDDVKFEGMFRKLIDGLELFYKDKSHGE